MTLANITGDLTIVAKTSLTVIRPTSKQIQWSCWCRLANLLGRSTSAETLLDFPDCVEHFEELPNSFGPKNKRMKLYLGTFAPRLDDIHERHGAITGLIPPLSEVAGELDLNFSLFLMAECLLYDEYAFNALKAYQARSPELARIFATIELLVRSGFIELVDTRAIVQRRADFLSRAVDAAMHDTATWLPSLKYHVKEFDKLKPKLLRRFSSVMSEWDMHSYGISSYLIGQGISPTAEAAAEVADFVMNTRVRRKTAVENDRLQHILRPPIENVLANILVSEELHAYPYTWGTLTSYYETAHLLAVRNLDEQLETIRCCEKFFSVAFQDCAPKSVHDWIDLLKDERINLLRKEIAAAVVQKRSIDEAFARDAISALDRARVGLGRWKTYSGLVSTGASVVVGTIGGIVGGIPGGVLGSIIPSAIQYPLDAVVERRQLHKFAWMYFRQEKNNSTVQKHAPIQ